MMDKERLVLSASREEKVNPRIGTAFPRTPTLPRTPSLSKTPTISKTPTLMKNPFRKNMPQRKPVKKAEENNKKQSIWNYLPDDIIRKVIAYSEDSLRNLRLVSVISFIASPTKLYYSKLINLISHLLFSRWLYQWAPTRVTRWLTLIHRYFTIPSIPRSLAVGMQSLSITWRAKYLLSTSSKWTV